MVSKDLNLSSRSKIQILIWIILLVVIFSFHIFMTNNVLFSFVETFPYLIILYFLYENLLSRDFLHLENDNPSSIPRVPDINVYLNKLKIKLIGLLIMAIVGIIFLFLTINDKYFVARLLNPLAIASSATYSTYDNYKKLLSNQL